MSYVLYDKENNIYAGLNGLKVVAVASQQQAVFFDSKKDNPDIKCRFYNAITGANFVKVDI